MQKHHGTGIPKPVFLKYLFSAIFCLAIGIYLERTAYKAKSAFQKVTGSVDYISMTYLDLPNRNLGKYRYIKIREYIKPFEVYVGKDRGDFTPALDKIDSIKPGDILTIYFDRARFTTMNAPVNRLAYYIDKGNFPVFIFSPAQFYLALVVIAISIIAIIFVLIGKAKGKII